MTFVFLKKTGASADVVRMGKVDTEEVLAKAYVVYLEEVRRHVSAAADDLSAADEASARSASGRFHTIRGGAGFFGLARIAAVAGELEHLLGGGPPPDEKGRARTVVLFDELTTLAGELPDTFRGRRG